MCDKNGRLDLKGVLCPKSLAGRIPDRMCLDDVSPKLREQIRHFAMPERYFTNQELDEVKQFVKSLKNVNVIDLTENDFYGNGFWDWVVEELIKKRKIVVCTAGNLKSRNRLNKLKELGAGVLEKLVWMSWEEWEEGELLDGFSKKQKQAINDAHSNFYRIEDYNK